MSPQVKLGVLWALRMLVATLFGYAGVTKLLDPSAFALEISRYELLPALSGYPAATLPATEVLIAIGLIAFPREWRRASALAAAILLLVFTTAAASAVTRGLNIECGCFGEGSGEITWLTLFRNLFLLGASLVAAGLGGLESPPNPDLSEVDP